MQKIDQEKYIAQEGVKRRKRRPKLELNKIQEDSEMVEVDQRNETIEDLVYKVENKTEKRKNGKNRQKTITFDQPDLANIDLFWNWDDYIKNQSQRNSSFTLLRDQNGQIIAEKQIGKDLDEGEDKHFKFRFAFSKSWIVCISMLTVVAISIAVFYLVFNMLQNSAQFLRLFDQKDNIILARKFQTGQVFYYDYIITTQRSPHIIKINYTFATAVIELTPEQNYFVAAIQKRRQQLFDENGTKTREILQDQSTKYLDLLKYGAEVVGEPFDFNMTEDEANLTFPQQTNATESINQTNGTSFRSMPLVLPIFRFSLFRNGTISFLSFPYETDNGTLSLLRCFVQMFSPLLTRSLYMTNQSNEIVNKQIHRLLQSNDTDEDSQDPLVQKQERQSNLHNFSTDDQQILLKTKSSSKTSGNSYNNEEESEQSSAFSNEGQIKSASLQSRSQFKSNKLPESNESSVVNFQLNEDIHQKAEMNVLESFMTNLSFVEELDAIFCWYELKNKTLKLSLQRFNNYISGYPQSQQANESSTRFLQQSYENQQVKIMSFSKKNSLLSTDVIGFKIKVDSYFQLSFTTSSDKINPLRKKTKFLVEVGIIVNVGYHRDTHPLVKESLAFDPLTLAYTLQKIQEQKILNQPKFVERVNILWNLILNGKFQNVFLPKIMSTLILYEDLNEEILSVEDANSPKHIINEIFLIVNQIRQDIKAQGKTDLQSQKIFIDLLYDELLKYYNERFLEALAYFNEVKDSLLDLKDKGLIFLRDNRQNFTQVQILEIQTQIRNIVPEDVSNEYKRQMEKAQPIIDFLDFVRINGLEYSRQIKDCLIEHEQNLVDMTKGIVDLYFGNQTIITNEYVQKIMNRRQSVANQNLHFSNLKDNVNISQMYRRTIQLFLRMAPDDFFHEHYQNDAKQIMNNIKSYVWNINGEKGDCCKYKPSYIFWRKCVSRNPAMLDQSVEPHQFEPLFQKIFEGFVGAVGIITADVRQSRQFIQNQSLSISEKYNLLMIKQQTISQINITQIYDPFVEAIEQRLTAAKGIRSRVRCGGVHHLQLYINDLESLKNFVVAFTVYLSFFQQLCEMVITSFNPNIYNKIVQNTKVIDQVTHFYQKYQQQQGSSISKLKELQMITLTYDPRQFAQTDKIANDVFSYYGIIFDSLNTLCMTKMGKQFEIESIRSVYKSMLDDISPLSNNFLSGELSRLKTFLGNATQTYYSTYLQITFCETAIGWSDDIKILYPDFNNFTLIYDLYDQLAIFTKDTLTQIATFKSHLNDFTFRFFKLFTPESYKNFILRAQFLADQFRQFTISTAYNLSVIRQQSKTMHMFMMAPIDELIPPIQVFYESLFTLKQHEMFPDLNNRTFIALKVIDQLSFDIIAFVVSSKDVIEYFQNCTRTFVNGTMQISKIYNDVCESFLSVDSQVNQQFLNGINEDLKQIAFNFNDTVFPNITQASHQIIQRYSLIKFKSSYIKELFQNSMLRLTQYAHLLELQRTETYWQVKNLTDEIRLLIQNLEIGSLNSIYILAIEVNRQFYGFYDNYPNFVDNISQFETLVNNDFRKIYTFNRVYDTVQKQIVAQYQLCVSDILTLISQSKTQLQPNVKFYQKFQDSFIFYLMQRSNTQLWFDFEYLWSTSQNQVNQIDVLLSGISEDDVELMSLLNSAKQKLVGLRSKISGKTERIENVYKQIRKIMFNIRSITFVDLDADMKKIIDFINQIDYLANSTLFDDSLGAIKAISISPLMNKSFSISSMTKHALESYEQLQKIQLQLSSQRRDLFQIQLYSQIRYLEEREPFMSNPNVIVMKIIKKGQLQAKSKIREVLPPIVEHLLMRLIEKGKLPIFYYLQPIPTKIGPFYLRLQIDLTFDAKFHMNKEEYRNFTIQSAISVSLQVTVSFSYGIAFILEFGIYIRGILLQTTLSGTLTLNNVLPMQMVKSIQYHRPLTDQNKPNGKALAQLQIKDLTIEIGMFLKNIWIVLIWHLFKICINLGFINFCISFSLPIGFKLDFQHHELGYPFFSVGKQKFVLYEHNL